MFSNNIENFEVRGSVIKWFKIVDRYATGTLFVINLCILFVKFDNFNQITKNKVKS